MAFMPSYEPYRVPGLPGEAGDELTSSGSASLAGAPPLAPPPAPTSTYNKQRRSSRSSLTDDASPDKHFGDRSCVRCRDSKQPAPPASKQVQQLEAKLGKFPSVQQQLSSQSRHLPAAAAVAAAAGHGPHSGSASAGSSQPLTVATTTTAQLVLDSVLPTPSSEQLETVADFLGVELVDWQHSLDWHTTSMAIGEALVVALLDASTLVCCARMPALRNLVSKVAVYKANLHALEASDQLAVLVLCSLGCRSTTRSELLGFPTPPLDPETMPPSAFLSGGVARDAACDALRRVMRDVCWTGDLLQTASWKSLQSLAGLTELLAFEEVKAKENHFMLRNAIGLWLDLVNHPDEDGSNLMVQRMIGTSLLIDDAYMSAFTRTQPLFLDSHVERELRASGINLPSFQSPQRLGHIHDSLIGNQARVDLESFTKALDIASIYVTQCYRTLAEIRASRGNLKDVAMRIRNLYGNIDETHASVQRFQQSLVNLSQHLGAANAYDPDATNHLILLAVRLDLDLVELVSHIHLFLRDKEAMAPQDAHLQPQDDFGRTMAEGELRLRKCLRLSAFYAKLYLTSVDKHVLFHLFNALELVSNWTTTANQRVGSPGGPVADEYEVSFEELENFLSDGIASSRHPHQQPHVPTGDGRLSTVDNSRPSTSTSSAYHDGGFTSVPGSSLPDGAGTVEQPPANAYFYPADGLSNTLSASTTTASGFVGMPSQAFQVDPEVLLSSPAPAISLSEHTMDDTAS
ncbi:hypothetical protein OIV83_004003, partial [Microbotryomycetes sp. JL201]